MIDIKEHGGIFGGGKKIKVAVFTPTVVFTSNPQTIPVTITGLAFKPMFMVITVNKMESRNGSTDSYASGAIFWPMVDDPAITKRGLKSQTTTATETVLTVTSAIYNAGTVDIVLNKSGGSVSAVDGNLQEIYFIG